MVGFLIGQFGFLTLVKIAIGYIGLILLCILGVVLGAFSKKQIFTKISLQIIGLTIVSGISILITSNLKLNSRSIRADKVVEELDKYKDKNGVYPEHLEEVTAISGIEKYYYRTDSLMNKFEISYSMDGWHFREYSSQSKEWIVTD